MTPLKPIENTTRVRAVASTRYKTSGVCSHPDCDRTDTTKHHIFGRQPGENGDSWFVLISDSPEHVIEAALETGVAKDLAIPHVVDLCGHGTVGHHGDIDSGMGGHQAWIKYEDGEFVWSKRDKTDLYDGVHPIGRAWKRVGPLNPQPGEPAKPAKKRPKREGPVRVASFAAPQDDPDAAQRLKDKAGQLLEKFEAAGHEIGRTVAVERALDYTLLNAGKEDF